MGAGVREEMKEEGEGGVRREVRKMTEEGMQGGDERGRIGGRCRRWGGRERGREGGRKGGWKGEVWQEWE